MKFKHMFHAAGFCGLALAVPVFANDDCIDATFVDLNSVTPYSTVGATDSGDQHNGSLCSGSWYTGTGADVWYAVDVPSLGTLTVHTCDPLGLDTDLALFYAGCASSDAVACSGDGSGLDGCQKQSLFSF